MPMAYRRPRRGLPWRHGAFALVSALMVAMVLSWERIEGALVERAWLNTQARDDRVTPWPGAGYWPTARLVLPARNESHWLYGSRESGGHRPRLDDWRWPHYARVQLDSGALNGALRELKPGGLVQVYLPGEEGWSYRLEAPADRGMETGEERSGGLTFMHSGQVWRRARFAGPAPRQRGMAGDLAGRTPTPGVRRFP